MQTIAGYIHTDDSLQCTERQHYAIMTGQRVHTLEAGRVPNLHKIINDTSASKGD